MAGIGHRPWRTPSPSASSRRSFWASAELIALARRCLRPSKRERPADAQELADEFGAYLTSLAERARAAELAAAEERARAVQERKARRLVLGHASTIVVALGIAAFV